jgi:hypothetical protein
MLASPPRPAYHHVNLAAAALRANQSAPPLGHWRLWPIPTSLLGRVKFTPATTCFAPDHKPELGRGGAFERHRRSAVGLHFTIAMTACANAPSAAAMAAHAAILAARAAD